MDWDRIAFLSEIEYSKALMSNPVEYPGFTHLYNPYVPWCGDFNRAVGVKIENFQAFDDVVSQVERIHRDKSLDRPDRFDIHPPMLDEVTWNQFLNNKGFRLSTAIFFTARTMDMKVPSEFALKIPSPREFIEWYRQLTQDDGYYEESWFEKAKPLQLNFIEIFKPYWLMKGFDRIGWVYCANFGSFARLFDVAICSEQRGKGLGTILLNAIRSECCKAGVEHIILQTSENLRPFYERAGFQECTRNSIVWLK